MVKSEKRTNEHPMLARKISMMRNHHPGDPTPSRANSQRAISATRA
jgi:ribosomal protein S24E